MAKRRDERGKQKGAQVHAEGQHGSKTHSHFLEQLHSGPSGEERQKENAAGDPTHADPSKQRLFGDREQHDEADKNQDKNRLMRDVDRHDHDRDQLQVPGGKTRHPELPPED